MDINSKVLAVLEGGYNLDVTAECAVHTIRTLSGEILKDFELKSVNDCGFAAVTTTVNKHKEFWEVLNDNKYKELERKFAVLKLYLHLGLSRRFHYRRSFTLFYSYGW